MAALDKTETAIDMTGEPREFYMEKFLTELMFTCITIFHLNNEIKVD